MARHISKVLWLIMLVAPFQMLLGATAAPTPIYSATKALNGDWQEVAGPGAYYVSAMNKTLVAWQMVGANSQGMKGTQIAAYDHSAKTWSERVKVGNWTLADDAHGYASLAQDSSGFLYAFFGSHNTTQPWAISTNANDITSWTQQAPLSGNWSYPSPVFVGTKIYVFYRNDNPTNNRKLVFVSGTPSAGSVTFGGITSIVDFGVGSRVDFATPHVVGTDVHITAAFVDSGDTIRRNVYYFVYKTATGALENHDGSFSTASGSLPISLATADSHYKLYDHGTGAGDVPAMAFDTNGDPHIIYADNGGSGVNFNLMHIKRTSGVWSAPVTVDAITPQGIGGGTGFVAIYNLVPGAAGQMEVWYVRSTGVGDKMRRTRGSDGVFGPIETILTAGSLQLQGSQPVQNALPEFRSIFCEIDGATDSVAAVVKRYAYGDSGPVVAAIPMTAVDANYSSVSLLMGLEGRNNAAANMIDESDSCFVSTVNGAAKIDTSQSKFGSSSLKLGGSGDYVTLPDDPLFRMPQNFTFEAWIRINVGSRLQTVVAKRPATGAHEYAFYVNASNVLQLQAFASGSLVLNITGTTTIGTGAWHHVAFSRNSTTWRAFLDGALEASGTESATPTTTSQLLHLGRDPSNTGRDFNGWIDEVRITSGVARYTAAFTAPVAAFPRR